MISNGHLYLSYEWVVVNLRTDTKKTCVEREYLIELIIYTKQPT